MSPRRIPYRYKLLLDEMLPRRDKFPLTNNFFNLRHIVHDYKRSGISDRAIVKLAKKENRIIITKNIKDFHKLNQGEQVDLIGISDNKPLEHIDLAIVAYLNRRRTHKMTGCYKRII